MSGDPAAANPAAAARFAGWSRLVTFWRSFRVALPPALALVWVATSGGGAVTAAVVLGVALAASALLAATAGAPLGARLRTISSVLTAYREGDFGIRARLDAPGTPLGDAVFELNELGESLRKHRLGELEAWTLLRKVMEEVDVVVLAVDARGRVKLANAEAARVLERSAEALLLEPIANLGLAELFEGPAARTVKDVPKLPGRWELRRGAFRLSGEPHTLLVLSDVSDALRDEERDAWKRLIRVMGHEINNSLAPIHSVADSLQRLVADPAPPADWREDALAGLAIVARRAEALGRFIAEYSRLARLPPPELAPLGVAAWAARVTALEQRLKVQLLPSPEVTLLGDADQLDQLLINLVKNAVEASLERAGGVRVFWTTQNGGLELCVDDDGPGVADTANLFVPFFTTKAGGSGIGLVLARQIAQAHGGDVQLTTRAGGSGARAVVSLPLQR
ncbi:MAG TPA: HAMP domain-containing sensor histidine kinase [Polyangiaceae bacterium]|nr:HAMP domain-containing sensor histidine kinase [Polyangiaceae bacterium]